MLLIKPSQISGEIMTLIEEADEKLVLVSPYYRIGKWYKLLKRLEAAKQKEIDIEIYVREKEVESISEVVAIGFHPIAIPNLHAKLYLNESCAIVSSMNLLLSSDTNSIDIGFRTENEDEYKEIWSFYSRYIKSLAPKSPSLLQEEYDWRQDLEMRLVESQGRRISIREFGDRLVISGSNRYEVCIVGGKNAALKIFGILSSKEYEFALANKPQVQDDKIRIELVKGQLGHYDTITGAMNGLKSASFNELNRKDARHIVGNILSFIESTETIKKLAR